MYTKQASYIQYRERAHYFTDEGGALKRKRDLMVSNQCKRAILGNENAMVVGTGLKILLDLTLKKIVLRPMLLGYSTYLAVKHLARFSKKTRKLRSLPPLLDRIAKLANSILRTLMLVAPYAKISLNLTLAMATSTFFSGFSALMLIGNIYTVIKFTRAVRSAKRADNSRELLNFINSHTQLRKNLISAMKTDKNEEAFNAELRLSWYINHHFEDAKAWTVCVARKEQVREIYTLAIHTLFAASGLLTFALPQVSLGTMLAGMGVVVIRSLTMQVYNYYLDRHTFKFLQARSEFAKSQTDHLNKRAREAESAQRGAVTRLDRSMRSKHPKRSMRSKHLKRSRCHAEQFCARRATLQAS